MNGGASTSSLVRAEARLRARPRILGTLEFHPRGMGEGRESSHV